MTRQNFTNVHKQYDLEQNNLGSEFAVVGDASAMGQDPVAAVQRSIAAVLSDRFAIGDGKCVPAEADFLLDFGLDSMQLVQILVDLELRYGIQVPESALAKEDFSTVGALAAKLCEITEISLGAPDGGASPAAVTVADAELDIKVHCVVSCLCHPLKKLGFDHRPFYFGVWDAEIFLDEQGALSYHASQVDHGFFTAWFEKLYGVAVEQWYDHELCQTANLERLRALLKNRHSDEWIMVMLDLFHLPERENKFNKNPFPHYVMLENMQDPEKIWMWDPDFRWEGDLDKNRVFNAILQPSVAGGYRFATTGMREPAHGDVQAYFFASMKLHRNPMTDIVRAVVRHHTVENPARSADLGVALRELPVLAIRKYAYEHGFAYFWRDLQLEPDLFESWCDEIERLVRTYDQIQYAAMKYASQPEEEVLNHIEQLLQEQDRREFAIKAALVEVAQCWQKKYDLPSAYKPMSEVSL